MDFIRNSCGNCYNIKLEKKNFKFNIYKAKITNVLISTDGGGCINELELIIVEWNPLNTDWIKMKKIVKISKLWNLQRFNAGTLSTRN